MRNISRTVCQIMECLPVISTFVGASEIIYKLARKVNGKNPIANSWRSDLKLHVASMSYFSCAVAMVPFVGNLLRLGTFAINAIRSPSKLERAVHAAKKDADFTLFEEFLNRHPESVQEIEDARTPRHLNLNYRLLLYVIKPRIIRDDEVLAKLLASNHPFHRFFMSQILRTGPTFDADLPERIRQLIKNGLKDYVAANHNDPRFDENIVTLFLKYPQDPEIRNCAINPAYISRCLSRFPILNIIDSFDSLEIVYCLKRRSFAEGDAFFQYLSEIITCRGIEALADALASPLVLDRCNDYPIFLNVLLVEIICLISSIDFELDPSSLVLLTARLVDLGLNKEIIGLYTSILRLLDMNSQGEVVDLICKKICTTPQNFDLLEKFSRTIRIFINFLDDERKKDLLDQINAHPNPGPNMSALKSVL